MRALFHLHDVKHFYTHPEFSSCVRMIMDGGLVAGSERLTGKPLVAGSEWLTGKPGWEPSSWERTADWKTWMGGLVAGSERLTRKPSQAVCLMLKLCA